MIDAFKEICIEQGVKIHTSEAVESVNIEGKIQSLKTEKRTFETVLFIGSLTTIMLLAKSAAEYRNYDDKYWQKEPFHHLVCCFI